MNMSEDVVQMDRLYLIDVDRTLFRSGEFMLALHGALLNISKYRDNLPDRDQVVRDISGESLPFAKYYHDKGIPLEALYEAAKTLGDSYSYDDVGVLDNLPGRVILYTKGERDTQEIKLHHSRLSTNNPEGGGTTYDERSTPSVWIVPTNKGALLKQAIDEHKSDATMVILRWNHVEYRAKELIFVDDKYEEIKPLVDLSRHSGLPLFLAHIVREDSKYGASGDRDKRAVVEISTLRDLEPKMEGMRNDRYSR